MQFEGKQFFAVNGLGLGAFAGVSMADIESFLKVGILVFTFSYNGLQLCRLAWGMWKKRNKGPREDAELR